MLQPSQRPLPGSQARYQLRMSRLAQYQAPLLHCDPSSLCPKPSSTSHHLVCLQAGHRAQLQLPWAEEAHQLAVAADQHLWVALAEAEEAQSLAALAAGVERHCLA